MRSSTTPIETMLALTVCLGAFVLLAPPAWAEASAASSEPVPPGVDPDGDKDHRRPEHGGLGNIGAKLANPVSDIWSLQFNFQGPTFFDGNLNSDSPQLGGNVIFQPVLPIPLYGTGKRQWRMVTRPIIPIIFAQPISKGGVDNFETVGGIGDIEIPLLLNLPASIAGKWIVGAGPVFEFPSAAPNSLGANQYSIGPAVVFGYASKRFTAVVFPNYFFGVGSSGDRDPTTQPTTSKLSLLYAFIYNLPNAWQVGLNPTISYNHNASSGNQWNVPVGLFVSKVIKVSRMPMKVQAGLEYSVVSPDAFGKRAAFRFVITPVIPGLIQKPIFGGK